MFFIVDNRLFQCISVALLFRPPSPDYSRQPMVRFLDYRIFGIFSPFFHSHCHVNPMLDIQVVLWHGFFDLTCMFFDSSRLLYLNVNLNVNILILEFLLQYG